MRTGPAIVPYTSGGTESGTAAQPLRIDPTGTTIQPVSGTVAVTGPATDANLDEKFGDLGQKNMAGSAPVTIASDQAAVPVSAASLPLPSGASTDSSLTNGTLRGSVKSLAASSAAITQVASANADTVLLASNANRRGAIFANDSTATCYLKFGSAASAVSYTVKLTPGADYQIDGAVYTGAVDGFWTAANGFMYVTEIT